MYISLNGIITETKKALVSPLNRGMLYGEGCFDTLRSYKGKLIAWDEHFDRLQESIEYLGVHEKLNREKCREQLQELIKINDLENTDAIVRIQCWCDGIRGYGEKSGQLNWMIQAGQYKQRNGYLNLILSQTQAIPERSLSRKYKLSNGLNFIKAAQEARAVQADDALMLNVHGFVSETTTANIFWIHDQTVFTPSESCDLLPGITRNSIIHLLKNEKIKLEIGEYSLTHLQTANAVFCTNSIREIDIVERLDHVVFETETPLIGRIQKAFETYKNESLLA